MSRTLTRRNVGRQSGVSVGRLPATKMFGGKRYERAGMSASKNKKSLTDWVKFQREANYLEGRVVKGAKEGTYEAYIRHGERRRRYEASMKKWWAKHHKGEGR